MDRRTAQGHRWPDDPPWKARTWSMSAVSESSNQFPGGDRDGMAEVLPAPRRLDHLVVGRAEGLLRELRQLCRCPPGWPSTGTRSRCRRAQGCGSPATRQPGWRSCRRPSWRAWSSAGRRRSPGRCPFGPPTEPFSMCPPPWSTCCSPTRGADPPPKTSTMMNTIKPSTSTPPTRSGPPVQRRDAGALRHAPSHRGVAGASASLDACRSSLGGHWRDRIAEGLFEPPFAGLGIPLARIKSRLPPSAGPELPGSGR